MSPIVTSLRRGVNSSSPTRRGTSSTRAIWLRAHRLPMHPWCSSTRARAYWCSRACMPTLLPCIASGTIPHGDGITVLTPGHTANVVRIVTWDGDLNEAAAPLSVTLVLDHEVDISRGDLIVVSTSPATVTKNATAALVWMNQGPL